MLKISSHFITEVYRLDQANIHQAYSNSSSLSALK